MSNDSRVQVDSSKALKALDELIEKLKSMVKYHEELEDTFKTAYANDNLTFYSKMQKLTTQFKESLVSTVKNFEELSAQTLEHSNRMAKFSEEY